MTTDRTLNDEPEISDRELRRLFSRLIPPTEDRLRTYADVARRWNKTPRAVREMMSSGKIPGALRIGGTWQISEADLRAYEEALKGATRVA